MSSTQATTTSGSDKVHPTSQAGFGEGKADLYDAVRPSYAPKALSRIRELVAGKRALNVVEIGCGSGIFTRALLAHPEWKQSIKELRCIEPNEGMRTVFSKTVDDPRVSLSDGTFDATGVPDHWADLIVMASAFHWCQDFGAAAVEFIRILKADGLVGVIWSISYHEKAAWAREAHELCVQFQKNTPSSPEDATKWRRIFDLPLCKETFSDPETKEFPFAEPRSLDSALTFYLTWSGIAIQPGEEKERIRERIRTILDRAEDVVWVDEKERILEFPFVNHLVTFRRVRKGDYQPSVV